MRSTGMADRIKTIVYYLFGVLFLFLVIGVLSISYVIIDGKKYDKSVEYLVISDSDFSEYNDYSFLNEFTHLKTLDLSALDLSLPTVQKISSELNGNVTVIWNVRIGDSIYSSHAEHLTVPAEMIADAEIFSAFDNLKQFEIEGTAPITQLHDVIQIIRQNNPDVNCVYQSSLYGVPIDGNMESICLDNKKIKKLDYIRYAIELFPNIQQFDMCDCGVTDEEMGRLRDEYPDKKFKWMLHILIYDIPTDVQVFSTLVAEWVAYADEKTFSPIFKYCTDLRLLDLGHWDHISDISEMRNLKDLEILIISDNSISDLSPLADLPHLKYMDLRFNKITDVTPLTKLQELQFLEIGGNKLKNAEKLCECRSLKYLYIEVAVLPAKTIKQLEKGLPEGCEFAMKDTRGHPWYYRIKHAFTNWKKVKAYHDWEHIELYD